MAFYKRPLLCLRLAECSLMALNKGLEFKVGVVGQGRWRQLIVEDDNKRKEELKALCFAEQCLWNALHLVGESKVLNHKNNGNGVMKEHNKDGATESSLSLYADAYRKESLQIKQAILADLAFVELELENPCGALTRARSLWAMPQCKKLNAYLAQVYAAEALCLLNRPKDVVEYLSVYFLDGMKNIDMPYSDSEESSRFYKPVEAQEIFSTIVLLLRIHLLPLNCMHQHQIN